MKGVEFIVKKKIVIALFILLTLLYGCENEHLNERLKAPKAVGSFSFEIPKIGQADAIIMKTENHSVIIDCGEKDDGGEIVELLKDNGISEVDCIFITHFDKDHVGGFPEVVKNITADEIFAPNYVGSGSGYEKYLKAAEEDNLTPTVLVTDTSFLLDDVLFEVSVPKKQAYKESDNDFSLVISVTHGENTFLFTGDAKEERLGEVLAENGKHYDFLKVPHHGKYNKKTKLFIDTINPTYAVICDSAKNPAEDKTISALSAVGCKIFETKDANVKVTSNGKEIKISQQD